MSAAIAAAPNAAPAASQRQRRPATNTTAMMRDNPRRHDFAGANAWGLRVLAAMRNDVTTGDFYDPEAVPFYEAGAARARVSTRSTDASSRPLRASAASTSTAIPWSSMAAAS